jgi:hypothetical protein
MVGRYQHFHICSFSRILGFRLAISDLTITGKTSNQPLLQFQGLEVTSLGEAAGKGARRSLFFRTRWEPAFDLLKDDPWATDVLTTTDAPLHRDQRHSNSSTESPPAVRTEFFDGLSDFPSYRKQIRQQARDAMQMAQAKMAYYYDKKHNPVEPKGQAYIKLCSVEGWKPNS